MSVLYDFDIQWARPHEDKAAPLAGSAAGSERIDQPSRASYSAQFRDMRTVEIVRGADPALGRWLGASGFGFAVHDSGAGPGRYPASDEAARNDVIARLSDNLDTVELKGVDLNGFQLGAFLEAVVEATPLDAPTPPRRPRPAPPAPGIVAEMPLASPSTIDAAFANPKAGARLPESDDREPSLDDLMDVAATLQPAVGPDGRPIDDLKFHPTADRAPKAKAGMPMMPMILVGVVMLVFVFFAVSGGQSGMDLVAR